VKRSDPSPSNDRGAAWEVGGPVRIAAVATASPPNEWTQDDVCDVLAQHFDFYRSRAVRRMFTNSGVETRRFCFGRGDFDPNATVDAFHALFRRAAPELAGEAARKALELAGVAPEEIGLVVAATCTGYLCPGLSAYLTRSLGLADSVQRADLVGMGCAGALPALQRGFDYVSSARQRKALVVAVEVCSACWFVDDTLETVVGNAICADGAASVVLEPAQGQVPARACASESSEQRGPRPSILGFESAIETEWMAAVGLENRAGRHRIVLSKELRTAAGPAVARVVGRLLERYALRKDDIAHWVFHAGGAAVLDNIDEHMGFCEEDLRASRAVFRRFGNMSSPTALFVLVEIQTQRRPAPGDLGVALALGPGLATEAALLRW